MKSLILFTGSYPYSSAAEYTFLPQEINVLSNKFKTITIVPCNIAGTLEPIKIKNVNVNIDYSKFISSKSSRKKYLLSTLFDIWFLFEIYRNLSLFVKSPICFKNAFYYRLLSKMTSDWLKSYFSNNIKHNSSKFIFQTWWFDYTTLGLSEYKNKNQNILIITRAHGSDLYEERSPNSYIPFRKLAIRKVDGIFSASQAGAEYLFKKYPKAKNKIFTGLLGVEDPLFLNSPSIDGKFRVVSCSSLIPLKRIDLLINGLQTFCKNYKNVKIIWTHIGSGPEFNYLKKIANISRTDNFTYFFKGNLSKDQIYDYYKYEPVDLFVNVSSTEGTPVSIMEAISFGIPILATNVGGNKEIVKTKNGIIINSNPSPDELCIEIYKLVNNPDILNNFRAGSRQVWQEEYNAKSNYEKFSKIVFNI